jgi:hypothetical protein
MALTDTKNEHINKAIRALLADIEALQKGRLQAVDALYANADSAVEVLNKIVAAQNK